MTNDQFEVDPSKSDEDAYRVEVEESVMCRRLTHYSSSKFLVVALLGAPSVYTTPI